MQQGKIDRHTPVQFLRGVGPHRARLFEQLQVKTVADLLEYYPRTHEFLPPLTLINALAPDWKVTLAGKVTNLTYKTHARPARLELTLQDPTGFCRLVWFHGGFLRDKFLPGDKIAAWGKVSRFNEIMQMVNPHWMKIEGVEDLRQQEKAGQAVYPATGGFSTGQIAKVINESLEEMLSLVRERYHQHFLARRKLPTRRDALRWMHRPPSPEHVGQARRRLAYDELFLMELGIALRREKMRRLQPAWPLLINERLDKRIRRLFPFLLTADQDKVLAEICADMARSQPMNRLLQGDVGSGKTVVALYAALLAVGQHYQAAIMAPTEILAQQHFISMERYLRHSRVKRVLLTGGLTGKKRTALMEQIARGQIDVVVGTQALLQHDVQFNKLALVVVDEQHKFGVRQRQVIRGKDIAPHYLVMTATPIPRTLAMTVFGDLEVSTIERLPPGRRPIITRWFGTNKLDEAFTFIRKRVKQGEQAYFVYPRVEESHEAGAGGMERQPLSETQLYASGQLKAAIAEREHLQKDIFTEFDVGLLHGQLDRREKQQIMENFRRKKIDILVSTVVIEVGVDVPNATIMVIEHADRFGLAQLHQLRGRIGRGDKQSYCLLFADAGTDQAQQRLDIMTRINNGFDIAEQDLRLRGPGEFIGTSQHGMPELKIADLLRDLDLLRLARRDAFALAKADPDLRLPEHAILRQVLLEQFGDDIKLVDVG